VRLETSNSSVELSLPANFATDLRVGTSNGGITLHMPYQVNAHVMARTTNSSISSIRSQDAGRIQQEPPGRRHRKRRPLVDLSTSNGSIRLLKM